MAQQEVEEVEVVVEEVELQVINSLLTVQQQLLLHKQLLREVHDEQEQQAQMQVQY